MPKVKIELLKEGMIVAADVKNMDNMLLMPAGASLSAKHINILQAWGISDIEVEAHEELGVPSDPVAQLPPDIAERLGAEIKALFWKLDESDPVQKEIFRLILRRRARKELGA